MNPTARITHLPEAYSRDLLDVSRVLESLLGVRYDVAGSRVQTHSEVIAGAALLCRAIARTLCVDPEATLLSVVLQSMEVTSDE